MNLKALSQSRLRFYLSIVWFVLITALTIWWWLLSLSQLSSLRSYVSVDEFSRSHRMIMWEGLFFILAIVFGGIGLILLAKKDLDRHEQIKLFFGNFAHDLKTSISRLRLQSELLREDLDLQTLNRLGENLNQLDLQLENSLWVARGESQTFHLQDVKLSKILSVIRNEWPEIELSMSSDALVYADELALRSVFRNLIQNSVNHGKATRVQLNIKNSENSCEILFQDNGEAFTGRIDHLGKNFIQPKSSHGNGLGLYLTSFLIKKLSGSISFSQGNRSELQVCVILPISRGHK